MAVMARDSEAVFQSLRRQGHRMTPQRRAIVDEIMQTRGHIAPAEIAHRVQARMPGVNDSTVYRTLDLLEDMGVIAPAYLGGTHEYHHADAHDHVHLVCSQCGRRSQLSVEEVQPLRDLMSTKHTFDPDFTHFAIWGRCAECAKP